MDDRKPSEHCIVGHFDGSTLSKWPTACRSPSFPFLVERRLQSTSGDNWVRNDIVCDVFRPTSCSTEMSRRDLEEQVTDVRTWTDDGMLRQMRRN